MTPEEYTNALMDEIVAAKAAGLSGVFKIRNKLTDDVAIYARDYVTSHTPYRVEFHKCPNCSFEWDIIIMF